MGHFNPRVADTGSPPIPEAYAWTARYDGGCGPLILLSQAAPSDPPHPELQARIAKAASDPANARYGDICGDAGLRQAYANDVNRVYGASVDADHVAITAGCNLAFVAAVMAVAKAGDAVLLPGPWYFNHKMTLDMLGIEARELPCHADHGFVPDPRLAEWLLDPKVKAIVLVTPNNPTGAIYPSETIAQFHAICRRRGLTLILDETYRDFVAPGAGAPHRLAAGAWPHDLVQLYSFSKAFHIPGHRLGAVTAAPATITEIAKLLDCLQICPPRIAQGAVAWGIDALRPWRAGNCERITALGQRFATAFAQLPGWRLRSIGSYFAYVEHPFHGVPGTVVAERLAVERGVLCLPASYFGPDQNDFLRIAFANISTDQIAGIVDRFAGLPPLSGGKPAGDPSPQRSMTGGQTLRQPQ